MSNSEKEELANDIQMRSLNGELLYPFTIIENIIDSDKLISSRDRFESFVIDLIKDGIISGCIGTSDGLNIISTNNEDDYAQYIMMTKQL